MEEFGPPSILSHFVTFLFVTPLCNVTMEKIKYKFKPSFGGTIDTAYIKSMYQIK